MRDKLQYRRFKGACPFYRENWIVAPDTIVSVEVESPLYEIYCLHDTPPQTEAEQEKCMHSPRACWRLLGKPAHGTPGDR